MKRKKIFILFFLTAGIILGIMNNESILSVFNILGTNVIVIDPGHGGVDGGAVSKNGVKESDINLSIALKLKELAQADGWKVVMTRETDEGLYSKHGSIRNKKAEDLMNRKKLIRKTRPDVAVSIHLNSFPDPSCMGAQTFYPPESSESKALAETIQEKLIQGLDCPKKRTALAKRDVAILKDCIVPVVLVECGFLSNEREEKLLQQDEYQSKIAQSIYFGIMKYFASEDNSYDSEIKYIVSE